MKAEQGTLLPADRNKLPNYHTVRYLDLLHQSMRPAGRTIKRPLEN
jgi:hypothetical protein